MHSVFKVLGTNLAVEIVTNAPAEQLVDLFHTSVFARPDLFDQSRPVDGGGTCLGALFFACDFLSRGLGSLCCLLCRPGHTALGIRLDRHFASLLLVVGDASLLKRRKGT